MYSIITVDPTVLAAIMAIHQDETHKHVSFDNYTFAYLIPVSTVTAKLQRKQERSPLMQVYQVPQG
jgi:hypothetical protein